MRGIAFIGGEAPGAEILKKIARGADIIAAADSGLTAAEDAGIPVDWVLGDMDSLDDLDRLKKYPSNRILRYPRDKDFTDTELALDLLREQGCGEIWIAGGGGGRIDHLFAIRSLFEREKPPDRWYPGSWEIRCLKEGGTVDTVIPAGSLVSVFPLGKEGWEAESSGLTWPLGGLVWERGSFGISNTVIEGKVTIRSIRGRFLITMPMIYSQ